MRVSHFLSLLMIALLLFSCGGEQTSDETAEKLLAEMEPYLAEKYGPLEETAYLNFFGGWRKGEKIPATFTVPSNRKIHANMEAGYPTWLHTVQFSDKGQQFTADWFAENDEALRAIDQVLDEGRASGFPGRMGIGGYYPGQEKDADRYDAYTINNLAELMLLRGKWELAQGRPKEAAEWFERIGRLGSGLINGRDAECLRRALAYLPSSLEGFQQLTWLELSPEDTRDALERLNALVDALPEQAGYDTKRYELLWRAAHLDHDELHLAKRRLLYYEATVFRQPSYEPFREPDETGTDTAYHWYMLRLRNRFYHNRDVNNLQLTFKSAFIKRYMANMLDLPWFQRDIGITHEELTQLSPKARLVMAPYYLGPTYNDPDNIMRVYVDQKRNVLRYYEPLDIVRDQFQQLRLAFAARIYRAETGRDPKSPADLVPDYLPDLPVGTFGEFEFRSIDDYDFWINIFTEQIVDYPLTYGPPGSNEYYTVEPMRPPYDPPAEGIRELVVIVSGPYSKKMPSMPFYAEYEEQRLAIAERLEEALGGYSGLIESMAQQSMHLMLLKAKLTLRLRPNLRPLAVVSPGPMGELVSDGPLELYNPDELLLKPSALVTLIHF